MFELRHTSGPLPSIELADPAARSLVVVAPSRGGMATRFRVGDAEVFYLDEATLLDTTKNVRGGNPVLFPSPGKLAGDTWARGQLKQHGFARNLPWRVLREATDAAASVTLGLGADASTMAVFPFSFEVEFTYALRGNELSIEMLFANRGDAPMPFGAGFHPYFAVPQAHKAQARVETRATRVFDNVRKQDAPYALDLTGGEVDLHLHDHGSSSSSLAWPAGRVEIEGSPEFSHWVIWSQPGKDFVCLEPWTCPGDALNTGERLITLEPGQSKALRLVMRFVPRGG